MDLRSRNQPARVVALLVALAASASFADRTVWLVRPLYPGQDALVERTERALDKLMPGEARKNAVIGRAEFASALQGRVATDVPCFSVDARCADPIDPFVAGLGFERIVLILGGQDEAGFKYRVVSYEPAAGRVTPASAANANLDKALLGAVAKVVPVASTLEVKSTPEGATVYVDDVKVGVTPLSTQVLPGERAVRLDLKLHQPLEETVLIPIRGNASLERTLEKVAARIVITASPPGTEISIDGQVLGRDKVDRGIAPGEHTIRLVAEQHKAFEQTITVKADQQYALDKTLEPLPGSGVVGPVGPDTGLKDFVVGPGPVSTSTTPPTPPPPPRKPTEAEKIYEQRSYFHASFEVANLTGPALVGTRFGDAGTGRTTLMSPGASGLTLLGGSLEYGTFGKYFGVTVIGASYLTNTDSWTAQVGFNPGQAPEINSSRPTERIDSMERVRVHMGVIRALQPQVRLALWRFMFGLQVGFEFRGGQISGVDPGAATVFYKDGFWMFDLLLAGRLNVRFTIVDGLFFHLQGNYSQHLFGVRATDMSGGNYVSASAFGLNVGVGYGF
jgi:hypothetical protein